MSVDPSATIYVNDFFKPAHKSAFGGPTGATRLLSTLYGSLAAAQVDYPQATALTEEIDLAVFRGAVEYAYQRSIAAGETTFNASHAKIVIDGRYTINGSVQVYLQSVILEGLAATLINGARNGGESAIQLTGAAGTLDAPKYALDFWTIDPFDNPPSGKLAPEGGLGPTVRVSDIKILGNGAALSSASVGAAEYKSGIRVMRAEKVELDRVFFTFSLWDGVVAIGCKRVIIDGILGEPCLRDLISIPAYHEPYDTHVTIFNIESPQGGRYVALLDFTNAVNKSLLWRNNSLESKGGTSFFEQSANQAWNVQGVPCDFCIIEGANVLDVGHREEFSSLGGKIWGDHHFIGCRDVVVENAAAHNFILATKSLANPMTPAMISYLAANGYSDITNDRNYNAGVAGDMGTKNDRFKLSKVYNINKLLAVGDAWFGAGPNLIEDTNPEFWTIPTVDGAHGKIVQHWETAVPLYTTELPAGTLMRNASAGGRVYNHYNKDTDSGDYRLASGFSAWAPSTAYNATLDPTVNSSAFLTQRSLRVPTSGNWTGFLYQAIAVTGTRLSGASEPSWPVIIGNTVVDNEVTWMNVGYAYLSAENLVAEFKRLGQRHRVAAAAPTVGLFFQGDKIIHSAPIAGGTIGLVCTTGGLASGPAVFKTYGAIAA